MRGLKGVTMHRLQRNGRILLVGILLLYTYHALQVYLPCLTLPVPTDDPRAQPILAALNQGYATLHLAYATQDVDLLATAFIDHPVYRWKLSQRERATLRSFITKVLGADAARDFGYLTSMQNKITYRMRGDQLLRAKLAESSREISELSETEWAALAAQNLGERPSLLGNESATPRDLVYYGVEKAHRIYLCGDKAELTYSDYITGRRAILLWRDGTWWIASIF